MKKVVLVAVSAVVMLVIFNTGLFVSSCNTEKHTGEGFAIYLTEGNVKPKDIMSLAGIKITDTAIIALNDIISYNLQTHEMKLTQEAFERIRTLEVPVEGKSFVVCLDKAPIYQGAFWTPVSSISYNGVTIWKPYNNDIAPVLTLVLGYPDESFYGGKDPRNDPRLTAALEGANKLVLRYTIDDIQSLPRSMKGYELYSWIEGDTWNFTLITGTNRNKTTEEITSTEDYISETGWIKIHIADEESLEKVVNQIPAGESVFWLHSPRSAETPEAVQFGLPSAQFIQRIKDAAARRNVDLVVEGDW